MKWILDLREKLLIPHTLKELINDESKFTEMSIMAKMILLLQVIQSYLKYLTFMIYIKILSMVFL